MKRTFKKSLALVLAVLMVMTVVPFAGAACEHVYDKYEYLEGVGAHRAICSKCNTPNYFAAAVPCSGGTATCQSGAVCTTCGGVYTEPSGVHVEGDPIVDDIYEATPATCKNKATYYYPCAVCEEPIKNDHVFFGGKIDPNGHQYVTAEPNTDNATHNAVCVLCTAVALNVECSKHARLEKVEPTCTQEGAINYTCNVCARQWSTKIAATGHDYSKESGVQKDPATCTTYNTYWYMCAIEGCSANAKDDAKAQDKYYTGTDKLRHVWHKNTHQDYLKDPATCQQEATYYYSCSECDIAGTETFKTSKGNCWFKGYTYNNDATCTEDGTETGVCEYCGEEDTRTKVDSKVPHEFTKRVETDDRIYQLGNCKTKTMYYHTCENCDTVSDRVYFESYTKYGPHKFDGKEITDDNYASYSKEGATCTKFAEFYTYCSVIGCGVSSKGTDFEATFEYGSKLDHEYIEKEDAKYIRRNATCEDPVIYSKSCKACGEAKVPEKTDGASVVNPEDIFSRGALGHDMKKTGDRREPTCLIAGVTEEQTCQRSFAGEPCGHKVGGEKIEKLDHQYKEVQKYAAPTCKRNGQYGQKKCELCGVPVYYDQNGETVALPTTLYATGHEDRDGDLICEKCDAYLEPADVCECICHNTNGLMYFIAKLIKWFWKFMNTNQMCECGNAHY